MKRIRFIQHYKLEPPYDHWTHLTLQQSARLGRGEVSPHIHKDIDLHLNSLDVSAFTWVDHIITSPTTRALETARAIKKHFSLSVQIQEDSNIQETNWDISQFLTEDQYDQAKRLEKYAVGDRRHEAFIQGKTQVTLEETLSRLNEFKSTLQQITHSNILCVTHSYLMKIIYLYFLNGMEDKSKYTPEMLRNPVRVGYLDGFDYYFS